MDWREKEFITTEEWEAIMREELGEGRKEHTFSVEMDDSGVEHSKKILLDLDFDDLPPSIRKNYMESEQQIIKDERDERVRQINLRFHNAMVYYDLGCIYSYKEENVGKEWVKNKKIDLRKAEEYFVLALARGNIAAGVAMATMCNSRLDVHLSDQYKFMLCPRYRNIGCILTESWGSKREEESKHWLEKVVSLNTQEIYESYSEVTNSNGREEWFKNNVLLAQSEAMYLLGVWNADDAVIGRKKDKELAVKWFEKATQKGNIRAMERLGLLYQTGNLEDELSFGKWIKPDKEKALQYYQNALALDPTPEKRIAWHARNNIDDVMDSGGKCFITTAVCSEFSKADDCYELIMFRKFRDEWLLNEKDGKFLVKEYYRIAPRIVYEINHSIDSSQIYKGIWEHYLNPCLLMIENGQNEDCKKMYMKMVYDLKDRFM